jgi:type II secretory pathway pseudopilin PulG
MPTIARLRRCEDGFTLAEMLVAMSLSIIVLFAMLKSLDAFTSHAARQSRITHANDQVRLTMDRTVGDLRGASEIVRAGATDLVYSVPEPTGVRTERLCVQSSELYGSSTLTASAPPAPTAPCSSGTKLATLRSTADTAFTYDGAASSANPALVKDVGLTFSLDAGHGGVAASSTLQASAARRAGVLALTDNDLKATCNASGALLSLGAGLPGIGSLTVTYATSGGQSLGSPTGTTLQIAAGSTSVVATVTDSRGVSSIIRRNVECA